MPVSSLHWNAIINEDIRFIHSLLIENHPGYHDDTDNTVKRILTHDWQHIDLLADRVESLDGSIAVLQRAVALFGDPHLGISPLWSKTSLDWAGIVPVLQEDKVMIALDHASPNNDFEKCEIVNIDGYPALSWLQENTLKFMTTAPSGLRLDRAVTSCFFDYGNPFISRPRFINVLSESTVVEINLEWRRVSASYCEQISATVLGVPQRKQGIEIREDGIPWVYVPTFDDSISSVFNLIRKHADDFDVAKAVVLDLRGNGGGNSARAMELLTLLLGAEILNDGEQSKIDWRATEGNASYLDGLCKHMAADSPDLKYLTDISRNIREHEKIGDIFYAEKNVHYDYTSVQTNKKFINDASIFVIIDGHCSSACLNFLDTLMLNKNSGGISNNITLMGLSTSGDSPYNDIRIEKLPSGLGDVYFPMKRISYERRKPYTGYSPDILYRGSSRAADAIENWALTEINQKLKS